MQSITNKIVFTRVQKNTRVKYMDTFNCKYLISLINEVLNTYYFY